MKRLSLVSATLLFLTAPRSFAQSTTAEIAGIVKDDQGGVLPGVNVAATNVASGLKVERISDGAGRFFLPALPVGEYTVTAELSGFRSFSQKALKLAVGQKIELSVTLQIGQLADSITVTGEAPLLRTT